MPAFAVPANLTWFHWTANHLPLAGQYDWPSLVPVALVAVVLFAVGVEAFARRDLGRSRAASRGRACPARPARATRPGRALVRRAAAAGRWPGGSGSGSSGWSSAAASRSFADQLAKLSPDTVKLFRDIFPAYDLATAGGFLQLVFIQLGFIVAGFAAATFVSGWASDETDGRLEMLLATPLARAPGPSPAGSASSWRSC